MILLYDHRTVNKKAGENLAGLLIDQVKSN